MSTTATAMGTTKTCVPAFPPPTILVFLGQDHLGEFSHPLGRLRRGRGELAHVCRRFTSITLSRGRSLSELYATGVLNADEAVQDYFRSHTPPRRRKAKKGSKPAPPQIRPDTKDDKWSEALQQQAQAAEEEKKIIHQVSRYLVSLDQPSRNSLRSSTSGASRSAPFRLPSTLLCCADH